MKITPRALPLTPYLATALYLAVALVFTWPLAAGLTRDIPWDLGDSLLNAWILAWDADRLLRFSGATRRDSQLLEREHFLSRTADARVLRTSVRAGGPDSSLLRPHRQHHPLLQPPVSLELRLIWARYVPVRARDHRKRARGTDRRPDLRVRAVSRSAVLASPGDLLTVDAIRPLRPAAIFPAEAHHTASRRRCRAHRAEPFERVLPAVLRAVRAGVRALRDRHAEALGRREGVGCAVCHGSGRDRGDAAVSPSVPRTAPAGIRSPRLERSEGLFGRRIQLLDVALRVLVVGRRFAPFQRRKGSFPTLPRCCRRFGSPAACLPRGLMRGPGRQQRHAH